MIWCEWDAPEGDPGQSCVNLFARILSMSFSSVSIFSVCCYSIVSISMGRTHSLGGERGGGSIFWKRQYTALYSTYVSTLRVGGMWGGLELCMYENGNATMSVNKPATP